MPRKHKNYADPQKQAQQPNRAPTGLPQGEHKALIDAQREIPLPNRQAQAMQMAQQQAQPPLGSGDILAQPTALPNEPPQTGLPIGPGAGPEAIQAPMIPATQDDFGMAKYLPMLEALADSPSSSAATRNFVRRMRGSIHPSVTMESMVNGNA